MSFLPLLDTQGQRATAGLQQWFTFFSALSRGKFHFLLIQPNFPLGQVIQLGQVYAASTPHMQLTLKAKSKVQINGRNGKNVAKQYWKKKKRIGKSSPSQQRVSVHVPVGQAILAGDGEVFNNLLGAEHAYESHVTAVQEGENENLKTKHFTLMWWRK